ncbi:MAG TPA: TrmO family methyltransferase [Acidimicrobiales bacterium]
MNPGGCSATTGVQRGTGGSAPAWIGLHLVEIVAIDGAKLQVRNLEALDGTPVIDLKPVLDGVPDS